jgi:hypothetical protein
MSHLLTKIISILTWRASELILLTFTIWIIKTIAPTSVRTMPQYLHTVIIVFREVMNKILTRACDGYWCSALCYWCSALCYSGTPHRKWNYCRFILHSPLCLISWVHEKSLQYVHLGKMFILGPEEIIPYVLNVNIVWPLNIFKHFNLVCLCTNVFFSSKLLVFWKVSPSKRMDF